MNPKPTKAEGGAVKQPGYDLAKYDQAYPEEMYMVIHAPPKQKKEHRVLPRIE